MKKVIFGVVGAALLVSFVSCKSTKEVEQPVEIDEMNLPVSSAEVSVVEWKNQMIGEKAGPDWLLTLARGNADEFKRQFQIDSARVVKYSEGTGKTQAQAQAVSRTDYFARLAFELKQKIIARIGTGMNNYGELESIYDVASASTVSISGVREDESFWQRIRRAMPNGKYEDSYTYWTVFSIDKAVWDEIVKNYMNQIINKADIDSTTQIRLRGMIAELQAEADKEAAEQKALEERAYQAIMQNTARAAQAQAEMNGYNSTTATLR